MRARSWWTQERISTDGAEFVIELPYTVCTDTFGRAMSRQVAVGVESFVDFRNDASGPDEVN